MLGNIDPIIIFQIYKLLPAAASLAKIPLTAEVKKKLTFGIIPIYLSETQTGIYIDSESKNIDIETTTDSLTNGEIPIVNQKTLASITTVNLIAKQGSLGLTILLALAELILNKATSKEYEVTYMHGGITVFGGLIHSFSVEQGTDNDLYKIKLELARGGPKAKSVEVAEDPGATRLGTPGATPPADAPTVSGTSSGGGSSQIQPNVSQGGLR